MSLVVAAATFTANGTALVRTVADNVLVVLTRCYGFFFYGY